MLLNPCLRCFGGVLIVDWSRLFATSSSVSHTPLSSHIWHLYTLIFNSDKDSRPPIPARYVTLPKLASMIRLCWSRNPAARPSFQVIVSQTKKFLSYARTSKLSPKQHTKMLEEHATPPPSPSLVPQDSDSLLGMFIFSTV
jgi:hypothetical protein